MANPVVFFRQIDPDKEEFLEAQKFLPIYTQRAAIPPGSLVIPRYSCLPRYNELEADVKILGSQLIHTYKQHRFIADIRQYYPVLKGITPETWEQWYGLPEGAYVLKGITNSKKFSWSTRMFAPNLQAVQTIARSLLEDAEIQEQGLVIRKYEPLVQYGEGLNGLPFTNEWRFFVLDGEILLGGFYWGNEPEVYPGDLNVIPTGAVEMVQECIRRVGDTVRFYVVDVAEKASGGWIVVELNDGCQSGLPVCDPGVLYRALQERLG